MSEVVIHCLEIVPSSSCTMFGQIFFYVYVYNVFDIEFFFVSPNIVLSGISLLAGYFDNVVDNVVDKVIDNVAAVLC